MWRGAENRDGNLESKVKVNLIFFIFLDAKVTINTFQWLIIIKRTVYRLKSPSS